MNLTIRQIVTISIAAVLAYFSKSALFFAIGFEYRPFHDRFDFGKFIIDFGTSILLFLVFFFVLKFLAKAVTEKS